MVSVALKFLPEEQDAPIVIASGCGYIGDKIFEIAKKNSVQVVRNPGLATSLLKVPIGEEIPEKLYKAVAGIFKFIYQLDKDMDRTHS
ncbi:MAG: EscU/YscU/HrcU family type III secretion system export apparatus switch protein [Leptospiraceae bacterium]|nr:EscU/YscU/HrcU family type III secretion system export apparatus switch protein [Leptospiraceae bacterium]MCP5495420.1 EscU/YscU/HrcU family type III secretion system export apparatus switch protein [Leptospiraceae bacterium]